MSRNSRILSIAAFAAILACGDLGADSLRIERTVLENGLEVIASPDNSASCAYVELVFRSGAESLSAQEAGSLDLLRRLVERSLSGESHAGDQPVWESYMGAESLGFRASLTGSRLAGELGRLASAISSPAIDEASLDEVRSSAIASLAATASDPDAIYESALTMRLFAKYPWRRFPAGSEKTLRAATAASLASVASALLRPSEASVVIAGAFESSDLAHAAAVLAAWTREEGAAAGRPETTAHPKPGVARPTWLVYPDPSMESGRFSVELRYRGPDAARSPASVLAGELWALLASNPDGRFIQALSKESGGSPSSISVELAARREGGTISISAAFASDGKRSAAERACDFKETARGVELTAMRSNPAYVTAAEYEAAKALISARRDRSAGDPSALSRTIAAWRAHSTLEAYLSYHSSISALGPKEISAFVDAYILKNLEVIALRMNPADYERERSSLAASGFETISAAKAFWR